ncbi:septation protein SepH [Ruania zhangjianzhongii]|uniref:septation protein SepH n=1 Tax=Ruania zhangjianzhongii TaxID=2603206 RepID=UPI0011C846BA|nr:septation protein SepH [Ruania zhangjianzhongii]
MVELELVGIHSDGEHLIVMAPDGERYRLVIDEALRAAVRRDRPHLEKVRSSGAMRPRDIQVQIRAGASAEDVAEVSGLPIETVRRYEGPVLAEREHVSMRAQGLPIGRDSGAPVLGDVVLDRLATRGVDTDSISWDARRNGHEPWQVLVRFSSGDKLREATWEVDLTAKMTRAVDDEARWLSETDLESPSGRRHLQSVRSTPLYDQADDEQEAATDAELVESLQAVDAGLERDARTDHDPEDEDEATAALLAELSASRGVRPGAVAEDDGVHEPMLWDDPPAGHPPAAHPSASHPEETPESPEVLTPPGEQPAVEPESEEQEKKQAPRRRTRKNRRTSVPSWDEIVFGAKND